MTRYRLRVFSLLILGVILLASTTRVLGLAQSATPSVGTPVAMDLQQRGEQIYADVCVACHQPGGVGVEGIYPALAGNPFVTLGDPRPVVMTVLYGRGGMPRFNSIYSDEEIASVASYIRSAWGNEASPVDGAYVAELRDAYEATPQATPQSETSGQDPQEDQPGEPSSE